MQVSIFDFEVTDHDSSHHFVASTVEFARGCSVLRSPLEIHNVKFGPMVVMVVMVVVVMVVMLGMVVTWSSPTVLHKNSLRHNI